MNQYNIVLLSGDGIGPEISEVSINILKKISNKFNFEITINEELFGGVAIDQFGVPSPDETIKSCKESDSVLLACVGDTKYDSLERSLRPETGLLKLRAELNLFANIRPVKIRKSLINSSSLKKEIVEGVDLIVVRELTGGIYFGEPRGIIKSNDEQKGFNTMSYKSSEINRITEVAIEIAKKRSYRFLQFCDCGRIAKNVLCVFPYICNCAQ